MNWMAMATVQHIRIQSAVGKCKPTEIGLTTSLSIMHSNQSETALLIATIANNPIASFDIEMIMESSEKPGWRNYDDKL